MNPASLAERFRLWLGRLELHAQISLFLAAGTLLIIASVALPAFVFARTELLNTANSLLRAQAREHTLRLELKLSTDIATASALATSTITANALGDSVGRETYLIPLLKNQKLQFPGGQLILTDYRGKPIANSHGNTDADYLDAEIERTVLEQGQAFSLIRPGEDRMPPMLLAYFPIIYPLTEQPEGMLIYKQPLDRVLDTEPLNEGDYHYLVSGSGSSSLLIGRPPAEKFIESRDRINLPPPLEKLQLLHILSRSRAIALKNLDTMAYIFVSVGLVLIVLALLLARKSAEWLIRPLRDLALTSQNIAETGVLRTLETPRQDEFGRLVSAFNKMVGRVRSSQDELENRVKERTRALAESETRLRYVMNATGEGLWDWNLHNNKVVHNTQWKKMLGLDAGQPSNTLDTFVECLHPEDRDSVLEAIRAGLDGKRPYVHEHRMVKSDGTVIWVLDRGEVVERDAEGKPSRMVGSIMDISDRKAATEEIRQRELYLRATLDNLPFLFWLKDAESRFLTVNRHFAEACGRARPEEVVGLSDLDIWPRDLAELYRADDREVIASRRDKAVEEPVHSAEGHRWIETYKKPVVTDDGRVLGTVGFARDITARKEMEKALEESQQRWQLAISGTNDGIFDWDMVSGKIFTSERYNSMLGYAPEELDLDIDGFFSMIHPEDRNKPRQTLERHVQGEIPYIEVEFRMRCKDGSYKWILARGRVLFGDEGRPIRMAGSHTDISAKHAAELAIRERTMQLSTIFHLSPDGLVAFDADYKVKFANLSFSRITGLNADQLLGRTLNELSQSLAALAMPGISTLDLGALLDEARSRDAVVTTPVLIDVATDRSKVLQVALGLSETREVPIIAFVRDVTHETEVDRMKSEFLSTAAHELRTPMASIKGFSELLLHEGFDEATRQDMLETINSQSELMASILNELLDLARIEARRGKDFKYEKISLEAFVAKATLDFHAPDGRQAPALERLGQEIFVSADRNKLAQVINNVLSNAYKYSPDGGPVTISMLPTSEHEGIAMAGFRITDEGMGMTPEQLSHLFERFYRADTSGAIPGTGLGMCIVKEIIDFHKGKVLVDSTYGQGTAVTILLPQSIH